MAVTLEDKKTKARLNRSRAVMSKINIIKAKYGSESPNIESQNDQDTFNCKMLFGSSGSEVNINYAAPGPEAIMRMYYTIIQNLTGVARDNMVSIGTTNAKNSSLAQTAQWITKGTAYNSCYFKSGASDIEKMQAMRGEWNYSGSGFTDNIYKPNSWDVPPGYVFTAPHDNTSTKDYLTGHQIRCPTCGGTGQVAGLFGIKVVCSTCKGTKTVLEAECLSSLIGSKSPIGSKSSILINRGTILGERFTDVAPFSSYEIGGGGDRGTNSFKTETGIDHDDGGGTVSDPVTEYTYGDGTWDYLQNKTAPETLYFDWWSPRVSTYVDSAIAKLIDSINYLTLSKITNFTYVMNKKCIPGYSNQYQTQTTMINTLTECINRLNSFKTFMNARGGISVSSTPTIYRQEINDYIVNTLIPNLNYISSACSDISTQIENLLGSPTTRLTLRWLRCELIKLIIDVNSGSKTTMLSIDVAGETMDKNITKAETEFDLYGMDSTEWIPTPEVVGIAQHYGLNKTTLELAVDGFVVAWYGQDHCTSYDVWSSADYDPSTQIGTWKKILSPGNSYTSQDIDINSGKVVTYIIDKDIDTSTGKSPYYKVKAYDNGGSGEYARVPATSLVCDPMCGDDFTSGGDSPAATEIVPAPAKIPDSPLTSVRMPGGIYKWPTMLKGSDAKDFERKIFESEVDFDNYGSNLTVYHNGLEVEQGADHEYDLVNTRQIMFHNSIPEDDIIILHVFFNIAQMLEEVEENGGSPPYTLQIALPYWKSPVAKNINLPSLGNSEGDIRLVLAEGKLYRWNGSSWSVISDGGSGENAAYWKEPVETFEELPSFGNSDGDVRLVTTSGNLYRWSATDGRWMLLTDGAPYDSIKASLKSLSDLPSSAASGDLYYVEDEGGYYEWVDPPGEWQSADVANGTGTSVKYWKKPVNYYDELPLEANTNGDVRLVINEKSLYQWDSTDNAWIKISGGESDTGSWKSPVDLVANLPTSDNTEGDIRYVYETKKIYVWNATLTTWDPVKAEIDESEIHHDKLNGMPDEKGLNNDHDGRYYTKSQLDEMMDELTSKLNSFNNLIPPDALDLSGNLILKSNNLKTGYLSAGNNQRFNTLKSNSEYEKIFKDNYFVIKNPDNSKYFRQGDTGELRVYINNEKISTFNLSANFDESKRKYGQTYTPSTTEDGMITILSVTPYNGFADFQIADFEVKIFANKLSQGENNIFIRHYISSSEQHDTYTFTVFYDNSTDTISFDNVTLTQNKLITAKYQSGVRFYSLNDSFDITFNAYNLFDNTYLDENQIKLDTAELGISNRYLDLHSEGVYGITQGTSGDILRYSKEITIDTKEAYSIEPSVYLSGYRVFDKVEDVKTKFNVYINTMSQYSTSLKEYFKDEIYRLSESNDFHLIPSTITGAWDSSKILTPGQLQVFNSQLIYPSKNYLLNIKPTQIANYSGSSGIRYYIRAFQGSSPKNNGTFIISGFDRSDPYTAIEIKLPSQTGWLSLNNYYSEGKFTGSDGDGCLIEEDTTASTFKWTTGEFSSIHSNYIVVIRITMTNVNANPINSIILSDWEE